jgi:transcription antitermination factor NusG
MPFFDSKDWFALQVIPRHEKKVDILLGQNGCEHLLPTYLKGRKWSDRVKTIEQPLFPGYVFFRTHRSLMEIMRSIPGIIRIVSFGGRPGPVPEEDIEALKRLARTDRDVRPFSYLNVGQKVQVVAGPLQGLTGIITEFKKRCRLVIAVDMIMKSVAVEIKESEVAPGVCAGIKVNASPQMGLGQYE